MDTFRTALAVTATVFFWFPVLAVLMAAGLFSAIGYSFGLVFLVLGSISSAAYGVFLYLLRRQSGRWYYGLPLAAVLLVGTVCAAINVAIIPAVIPPGAIFSILVTASGVSALLLLAPAVLLLAVWLQYGQQQKTASGAVMVSGIVSVVSFALLLDSAVFAAGFTSQQLFRHPFWEGIMILYGMGTAVIGMVILILAGKISHESLTPEIPGLEQIPKKSTVDR